MDQDERLTVLTSETEGIGRSIWVFGRPGRLTRPEGYSRERGVARAAPPAAPEGLVLTGRGLALAGGAARGSFETGPVEAPEFDWLVAWWNIDTAGEGAAELSIQAETASGWTGWLSMGRWSRAPASLSKADGAARVDTDTLLLSAPALRYRLRLELSAGEKGAGAALARRVGVITRSRAGARRPSRPAFLAESANPAPARSQMIEAEEIRGRICSPTSCAMALERLGIDLPTAFVAADCYDAGAAIYGNWPFNVASLWRLGAAARLDFFPNFESALPELMAGRLLIASVKFGEGELASAPIRKTNGHLVLVTGLEKDGHAFVVLVNDPAAPASAEVPRRYDLSEFERAWTGLCYVVEGRRSFSGARAASRAAGRADSAP